MSSAHIPERPSSTSSAETVYSAPLEKQNKAMAEAPVPASPLSDASTLHTDTDTMHYNYEPPDGGREAWLVIFSAFLLMVCVFGFVTSMGQLTSYYLEHQLAAYTKAQVAWIATVQSTLAFFASIFFGRLFDAHGATWLVRIGTTLSIVALIGLAYYYQFLLAHALFGFACSVVWSPAASIAGHWFTTRRSTAIGIVGCGSGVGGVLFPIVLAHLLPVLGFRDAIFVVAAINAVLMVPSWIWLRTRLPPRQPLPWSRLAAQWKEPRYACLVVGSAIVMLNLFSPYFDAPVLAEANGVPAAVKTYAIAILQAGSTLGRAASGVMADAFGIWRVFLATGLATAVVLFAFWTVPVGTAPTVLGMLLYGFTSGAWIMLLSAVTVSISKPEEVGMRVGMCWTVVSLPILAGPVICGVLIAADDNKFTTAGIFCGITYVVGCLLTVMPRGVERWRGPGRKADVEAHETCM